MKNMNTENSRAPSYFSHFFSEQLHTSSGRAGDLRTLYIDRDPDTFRDIALHLQGYHIVPKDGEHFVRLFADAQFYSCKYMGSIKPPYVGGAMLMVLTITSASTYETIVQHRHLH